MSDAWWLALALSLAGCLPVDPGAAPPTGGSAGAEPAVVEVDCATATVDQQVRIADFAFEPRLVVVPDGGTVQWTNEGAHPHTVTSGTPATEEAGAIFDSGALGRGQTWCARFDGVGALEYHCAAHPSLMSGATVQVTQDLPTGTGGTGMPPTL